MNRKLIAIIGVLILASLSLSACGAAPAAVVAPAAAAAPATTVTLAETGTTAEGRILPLQSANLSFSVGGQVAEIPVKEGDIVKAGDVIARLKNESLRAAVAEAQAGVDSAKAAQANYQRQLPRQIAATEAEVKAAQARQVGASAGRNNQAAIIEAEATLAQAKYSQQQLETALQLMYLYKKENSKSAGDIRLQLQSAIEAAQAAQARLNALRIGSLSDRASVAQIDAASASEAAAQVRLDQLKTEAAGKTVDTYAAAIKQAEASLLAAQLALSETEIKAPFAGTIAKINLKLGEQVAAGTPALVLADLSGWRVETNDLTEIKVPSIKAEQLVTVKADALPDIELKGKVESIGEVSQLKSGDVVYTVKVSLVDNDPRLRWGMTVVVKFGQ
ncbi:MAG TPA: HlyD family efflux transporter periplasmic adaptor subunit [Anaerolineae bacterium]